MNTRIVNIIGTLAVLSLVLAAALSAWGQAEATTINQLLTITVGAIGVLGGAHRTSTAEDNPKATTTTTVTPSPATTTTATTTDPAILIPEEEPTHV